MERTGLPALDLNAPEFTAGLEGGQNLLHVMVTLGYPECAGVLCKFGMDVHHPNSNGRSPLWLVLEAGQTEFVEQMCKPGVDLNKKYSRQNGQTPLMIGAIHGRVEVRAACQFDERKGRKKKAHPSVCM